MATELHIPNLDAIRDEADDVPSPLFSSTMPFWPSGQSSVSPTGQHPRRGPLGRTWSMGRAADREATFATPASKVPADVDNLRDQLNRQKMKVARLMEADEQRSKELAALLLEKRVLEMGKEAVAHQVEAMEAALRAKEERVKELEGELEGWKKETEEGTKLRQGNAGETRSRSERDDEILREITDTAYSVILSHDSTSHDKKAEEAESRATAAEGKLAEKEREIGDLQKAMALVTAKVKREKRQHDEAKAKLWAAEQEVTRLVEEVEGLKLSTASAAERKEVEEKIEELEEEKETLKEDLATNMKKILESGGDRAVAMGKAEEECARFEEAKDEVDRQLSEVHGAIHAHHPDTAHSDKLKESESRAVAAEQRLAVKERELADCHAGMAFMTAKLAKEKKLRHESQAKVAALEEEVKQSIGKERAVGDENEISAAANEAVAAKEKEVSDMRLAMTLLTTKLKREKKHREEADTKVSALEAEVKRLVDGASASGAEKGEPTATEEAVAAKDQEISEIRLALTLATTKVKRERKLREETQAKLQASEQEVKRLVEERESGRHSSTMSREHNGLATMSDSDEGHKPHDSEKAEDEAKLAHVIAAVGGDVAAVNRKTDEMVQDLLLKNEALHQQLSVALEELAHATAAAGTGLGKDELLVRELEAYSDESERLVQALKEKLGGAANALIEKEKEVAQVSLERDDFRARLEDLERQVHGEQLMGGLFSWCRGSALG